MSGSSGAAKKLSPKRTALNLCKITLSRWKRNWVSRASPDRCEILWPRSLLLLLLLLLSQHPGKQLHYARDGPNVRLWHSAKAEGLSQLTERVPNVRLNFGRMLYANLGIIPTLSVQCVSCRVGLTWLRGNFLTYLLNYLGQTSFTGEFTETERPENVVSIM